MNGVRMMMSPQPNLRGPSGECTWARQMDNEIFVVDDDGAVRDALRLVFEIEGFRVRAFPTARRSWRDAHAHAGLRAPGRAYARALRPRHSAANSAPTSRAGVHDLRPGRHPDGRRGHQAGRARLHREALRRRHGRHARARRARGAARRRARKSSDCSLAFAGEEQLTPREREVLEQIALGRRTRKPAASSASARAPSRCTARASWRSSARATPPTSCASSIRIHAEIIDRHQETYR